MPNQPYRLLAVDELAANHGTVSRGNVGLFLCRRGEADILLDNRSYHIMENVMCIYTPYTYIRVTRRSPGLDGILLEAEMESFMPMLADIPVKDRLAIRANPCIQLDDGQRLQLEQAIRALHTRTRLMLREERPPQARLLSLLVQTHIHALCLEVMEIYMDSSPVEELPQGRDERIFNSFLMEVFHHCAKERQVSFYAERLNLSPGYLSSVVKQRSGHTAMEWIETATMTQIRHHLGFSRMSIKEISYRMGFPDQSTFGRYFKKHCGLSPSEFRKTVVKKDSSGK